MKLIDRIKTMKIVFKKPNANWFHGLGLHHASIVLFVVGLGHFIGMGHFMAIFAIGWYASREWGWDIYPPRTLEVLDFISPAVISIIYLWIM